MCSRDLAARGAHLVGADGGGDVIARAGLHPEAIIGDFDSLEDPDAWEGKTELRQIAEQEHDRLREGALFDDARR